MIIRSRARLTPSEHAYLGSVRLAPVLAPGPTIRIPGLEWRVPARHVADMLTTAAVLANAQAGCLRVVLRPASAGGRPVVTLDAIPGKNPWPRPSLESAVLAGTESAGSREAGKGGAALASVLDTFLAGNTDERALRCVGTVHEGMVMRGHLTADDTSASADRSEVVPIGAVRAVEPNLAAWQGSMRQDARPGRASAAAHDPQIAGGEVAHAVRAVVRDFFGIADSRV
ncbi:MAG: hypothetical protein ACYDDF_12815 [Thermoplasmatota archaeon]